MSFFLRWRGRGAAKTPTTPFLENIHRLCPSSGLSPCHFQAQLIGHTKTGCTSLKRSRSILSVSNSSLIYVLLSSKLNLWNLGNDSGSQSIPSLRSTCLEKTGPCPPKLRMYKRLRNFLWPGKLGKLPMRFGRHRERIWDTVKRFGVPYFPWNTGCLMTGSLCHGFWNNPHITHITGYRMSSLYTQQSNRAFFHCSFRVERHPVATSLSGDQIVCEGPWRFVGSAALPNFDSLFFLPKRGS